MTDAPAPIRVLHLIPQLSRLGGGASAYVWDLVKFTAACGVKSSVAGLGDEFTQADIAGNLAEQVFVATPRGKPARGFSDDLSEYLRHRAPQVDLIHSHGLRNGIGLAALRHAKRTGLPLIVSPHGMLYPQLLERGRVRKWIVDRLWDARYRATARVLHATSDAEATIIRAHHSAKPIAVVPIGLDTAQFSVPRSNGLEIIHPALADKKRLLFLGIMDRKKGLLRLIEAWRVIHQQFPDWQLLIAGTDLAGHEQEVRAAVVHAGVQERVTFLGGVYGVDKAQLYAESDLFVLPTEWENFGIAVAEALASRVPVITTHGAPWSEIARRGCGWWIENTPLALTQTLRTAMNLDNEDRAKMGAIGHALIEEKYAWPAIAGQMRGVYEWMLGRGELPEVIRLPSS